MSTVQWTCFDPDQPSNWTKEDFGHFIRNHRWTFARTMPENPHEYTLRRHTTEDLFNAAVRFIREQGQLESFQGKPYKVLYFENRKYWTMGAPLAQTILINRKSVSQD
jgi:hypothetical protein